MRHGQSRQAGRLGLEGGRDVRRHVRQHVHAGARRRDGDHGFRGQQRAGAEQRANLQALATVNDLGLV